MESFSSLFLSFGMKSPLSSCEEEIRELMRQIDIMVNARQAEWETNCHAMQVQLEKRNKEIGFLKTQLEDKNYEVGRLHQKVEEMDSTQRDIITEYEDQLLHLKAEMDNLKHEHEKLQKKNSKQVSQIEKERDQLVLDLRTKDSEVEKYKNRYEECRNKANMDWEGARKAWEDRIRGLEGQKKALLDKSDMNQQQLLGYQAQLNKRRHMLESVGNEHQMEVEGLETQLHRARIAAESKEETIQELKGSLEKVIGTSRDQASEVAKFQSDLRNALSAIERLEEENVRYQVELQARDDLIRAAEEDQRQHTEDISKLQHAADMKDGVIRHLEESMKRSENLEVLRMKEELKTSKFEIQGQIDAETFHKEEIERLNHKLEGSQMGNAKLRTELQKKNEEIRMIEQNDIKRLSVQNSKLKEKLASAEETHAAEMEGMKEQVANLTADLHKRDNAVASISEQTQQMEREMRNVNSRHERSAAELQVTNAQLEAVRLENRHLRDTSLTQQLSNLSAEELYTGNVQVIGQLEEENRRLRTEIASLHEELSSVEARHQEKYKHAVKNSQHVLDDIKDNEFRRHSEIQTEAGRKIATLESRLEATVRKYETQLHLLQSDNELLRSELSSRVRGDDAGISREAPMLQDYVTRRHVDTSHASASTGYTDTDALAFTDLTTAPGVQAGSERSVTPQGSRRASITADFVDEEDRREKELERILDRRIADLKANTDYIIQKYT